VISRFVQQTLAGEPVSLHGDGVATRDFVHARDVAQAALLALDHPRAPGGTFNVGTGRETSVRELAEMVRGLYGGPPPRSAPGRAGDVPRSVADISRLRELGYVPSTSLMEDLRALSLHMQAHAQTGTRGFA
jgi:nucleoside-diphosphate-sugar epimerase